VILARRLAPNRQRPRWDGFAQPELTTDAETLMAPHTL
jgi:hypothetical protein